MSKHANRLRSLLDVLVTIAMGVAAVALLWRLTTSSTPLRAVRDGAGKIAAIEDLRATGRSIALDGASVKGQTDAPVVMIEFTDFECPFCARFASQTFGKIQNEFVSSGKVQYALRHAPLKMHPVARPAAQAAECAGRQGKFWEAHDHLFNNQNRLALALWFKGEHGVQIDPVRFEQCMAEPVQARIDADLLEASRLKVEATPTFFVGTRMTDGKVAVLSRINGNQGYDVFENALGAAGAEAKSKSRPS